MAREAKIGIALIGILLVVFGALLVKRMSRASKVQVGDLAGSAQQPLELAKRKLQQPAAPTLVTAKSENSKPPDGRYGARDDAPPAGNSRAGDRYSGSTTPPRPDSTAANVLKTPLAAAEAGDRYAQSKRPQTNAATAQPYRSGYAAADEKNPSAPTSDAASGTVDPYGYRGGNGSDRYDAAVPSKALPTDSLYVSGEENNPFRRVTPQQIRSESAEPKGPTASYRDGGNSSAARTNAVPSRPASTSSAAARYPTAPQQSQYDHTPYNVQPGAQAYPGMTLAESAPGIQLDGDKYTVGPNDSYWTVSEKAYGNGAFFKALYQFNHKRKTDADELTVGQVISVPEESVLRRKYPDMCPKPNQHTPSVHQRLASAGTRLRGSGRTYTVVEGDTLFEIARYELGKSARWGEIYDLNRDVLGDDFDYLRPGLELILPDDGRRRENVTRQPDAPYPR